MQARIVPGLRPVSPPVATEPGVRPGPDLVPVITCGTNAQGRRFVTIWIRNDGSEATRRPFVADYTISGRGFISGNVPVSSLRPGQSALLENTADDVLQGIRPVIVVVRADRLRLIPEDINPGNNEMLVRCFPMPIVQSAMAPMGL